MPYAILYQTVDGDHYISQERYDDLDSTHWQLEIDGYAKESDTKFHKGIGNSLKIASIYKTYAKDITRIKVYDKYYTFRELSEQTGVAPNTLRLRYQRGKRNDDLIRPIGKKNNKGDYKTNETR